MKRNKIDCKKLEGQQKWSFLFNSLQKFSCAATENVAGPKIIRVLKTNLVNSAQCKVVLIRKNEMGFY